MLFLYNIIVQIANFSLKIIAQFSPKIKLFVDGRKPVFKILTAKIKPTDKTIWFHAASLGEYEQGLPVIEKIKEKFPNHKIVITFFSPSGYEVRKNNTVADITVYLPLDTKKNATAFIKLVHPEMAFFIKYEYWPNYLNELRKLETPTYLISGIFRKNQMFFKWYGGFYRKALDTFTYFFVQNESSKKLLLQLGKTNVAVSGDTRFDRVATILEKDNSLDFIEAFKNDTLTIVIGSSWPKDESLLVEYINQTNEKIKFIIAPHNIKNEQIQELKNSISKKTVLLSEVETGRDLSLQDFDVFIIDTIGILTKIYSYADIAYVGGGFGNPGVHNILEPATFGVPIVIGPNFSHFAEATALVNMEGCLSIANKNELYDAFSNLIRNDDIRHEKGHICNTFVQMNKGATTIILKQIPKD
ncbi:3-deoxy-D-manno-octulosonic acid transferase [Flavobacterium franklandianum]|uniref:3-deoxy-D-manno-octulosonic acid transferase n=1 Tax=Flavobacterium franklandianum TaxID=2594430 RepID=UPI001179E3E3|nr:glycosyltransferase N-terminal domain-containing protein [Flavobacterium franklandianum]TRX26556.1 3-deoxy-D-manno-octulosonic acid transferase [Flavobacterium franklandianum]